MIALHALLAAPGRDARAVVGIDGANVVRFDTFRAHAAGIAARLSERAGRRFALWSDDPYVFACALFGALAAGKVPVIPANTTPGYLAELSDAYDAVLDDSELAAWCADASAHAATKTADPIDAHAPLTLFTSGSSGTPKPVHKTLAQFDAEVRTLEAGWGALLGDAVVLASVPHHHIYGLLFRVFWPLAAGRPFDRATCADPAQLQARIAQCSARSFSSGGATVVVSTPAQLSRWPELPGFAALAPQPRAFFSSGGPLSRDAALRYAATFGAAPLEIYGSTETGGIARRRQSDTDAWTPMHGIAVRAGDDGALEVRSPHLGHDDWHRTDDKAAFDEQGRFRLQGRLDRVVKLDGKRVSLGEMESRLLLHANVADVRTVPLAGGSRQRIGALVVLSAQGRETLRRDGRVALVKVLRRHLAAYFDAVVLPRHWRIRRALPVDVRGKVQAQAVAQAFATRDEGFELLAEWDDAQGRAFEIRVPHTLVHFAGHFPGLPILPGVVQVDWALRLADEWMPGARALASVEQLKFMAPVPPGVLLRLALTHDASRRRIGFVWRFGERDCASGVIVYREAA
ncbi:acyl-coenzyme A synthetase/AMP-(fatty) acid ligase [Paraburkholderia caballeronis]|uniref:AMP-binding protein n=1 Tax=Paraburkholderia caballeronis TaxID=416943 RepID=UPI0010DFC910|nr:AMP-binding protein [Paraburkholderia caballeronis]TDV39019.1 acyl-coenzyme A synthetase/AMP-(fatty) acid ligase [Paraburkholderia caballeronis]